MSHVLLAAALLWAVADHVPPFQIVDPEGKASVLPEAVRAEATESCKRASDGVGFGKESFLVECFFTELEARGFVIVNRADYPTVAAWISEHKQLAQK